MANNRWTKEMTALLGTQSDSRVAKRLKISKTAVACKRRRSKIKARYGVGLPGRPTKWGQVELGLLCYPDAEVARLNGRTIEEIKAKLAER